MASGWPHRRAGERPAHAQVVLGIETPDLEATIRDLQARGVA